MTDKDTSKAKALTAPESVERFHASEFSGTMIRSNYGDWVRHSDYDVLSAALEAKNDALTRATFRADVHENRAEAAEDRAEAAEAKMRAAEARLRAAEAALRAAKVRAALASPEGDKP